MKVDVYPFGWGDVQPVDIEAVLSDVIHHLTNPLRAEAIGTITVFPAPHGSEPMTFYRSSPDAAFRVQLTARDRHWSQYAFQFAHECCHVLTPYEKLKNNPNNWFHESICEVASLFTLRRMAETWRTNPPYPNWKDYADSLAGYAHERLCREGAQLPQGATPAAWLLSNEDSLREDPYQRDKNSIVAHVLLPIFERNPQCWNAVLHLPSTAPRMGGYLIDWQAEVEPQERGIVSRLSEVLCGVNQNQ